MPTDHTLLLRGVTLAPDSAPTPLIQQDGDTLRIHGLTRKDAGRLAMLAASAGAKATIVNPITVAAACNPTIGVGPMPAPPPHARTVETEIGTVTWWEVRDGE